MVAARLTLSRIACRMNSGMDVNPSSLCLARYFAIRSIKGIGSDTCRYPRSFKTMLIHYRLTMGGGKLYISLPLIIAPKISESKTSELLDVSDKFIGQFGKIIGNILEKIEKYDE